MSNPQDQIPPEHEALHLLNPDRLIDGDPTNITAELLDDSSILVTWNAPNSHVSLTRNDLTTGIVTTPLNGGYSPYNDIYVAGKHTYQYILTTLDNGIQYYSNRVTTVRNPQTYPEKKPPTTPDEPLLSEELTPHFQIIANISAALSENASGNFIIVVTWHAPDSNNHLARIDQTTATTTTPLPGFQPNHSPYTDPNIQHDHTYQYILTSRGSQHYSNAVHVPTFKQGAGPIKIPPTFPDGEI